jgi:hypothetical protein
MAGRYGPASVTVSLEDAPGGTARDIHNFILNGITAKDIARMMQSDCLGDTWEEHIPTGKKAADPITLEGLWDTTATTGTHAVFGAVDDGPNDDGRELVVVFGDSTRSSLQTTRFRNLQRSCNRLARLSGHHKPKER